jgi:hypothetical protein
LVQKLSLEGLTWEVMKLRLPQAGYASPCFKLSDSQVYLLINHTLYSFTSLEVKPVQVLSEGIQSWGGASYYCRGTLYCSTPNGGASRVEIAGLVHDGL